MDKIFFSLMLRRKAGGSRKKGGLKQPMEYAIVFLALLITLIVILAYINSNIGRK